MVAMTMALLIKFYLKERMNEIFELLYLICAQNVKSFFSLFNSLPVF